MSENASLLIMMVGLPGSGKSTMARELQVSAMRPFAILSRDEARRVLGLSMQPGRQVLPPDVEARVAAALDIMAEAFLSAGVGVIIDAMNLGVADEEHWSALAEEVGAGFRVWAMGTSVEECIRRDEARGAAGGRCVGGEMIRRIAANGGPVFPGEGEG